MQSCLSDGSRHVYPVFKQLMTKDPIIIQIDGLLTPAEASYLVQKSHDAGFEASETAGHSGEGEVSSLRTSRTSFLPEDDPVVACVRKRLAVIANMLDPSSPGKRRIIATGSNTRAIMTTMRPLEAEATSVV